MKSILIGAVLLASPLCAETFDVAPGPEAEAALQEALILAQPGDEVVLAAGTYAIAGQTKAAGAEVGGQFSIRNAANMILTTSVRIETRGGGGTSFDTDVATCVALGDQ